ncbi:MAG: autotransporter-associated beta strand repeat-containing protein [Opitutaceae bacterium]|jgi:autotransporter-associated beta strand protein|nr:autotransporter-associated beta strand repeat-containing protein [Opitutaceae bacterium]
MKNPICHSPYAASPHAAVLAALVALVALALALFSVTTHAADYSWKSAGNSTYTTAGNWLADGVDATQAPHTKSENNIVTPTAYGEVLLNGENYRVNNFNVTLTSNWLWRGPAGGDGSLYIDGTLAKAGSAALTFTNNSNNDTNIVQLGINRLDVQAGVLNFGRTRKGQRYQLASITVTGATTISTGATLNINSPAATFAEITLDNNATLNILQGHDVSAATTLYTGGITTKGLSGSGGLVQARDGYDIVPGTAEAFTSARAATGTLIISNATEGEVFSFGGVIADGGTGSTLALTKKGASTQILAGTNTWTGGTNVEGGTLIVSGSLAATGTLDVSAAATFLTANKLTVGNTTLADGAILGFDLDATSGASLIIDGNLTLAGAFVIDFGGTGIEGQTYANLFSVTGTGADVGIISFINFGIDNVSGQLAASQLADNFTIGGLVPEPATVALVTGLLTTFAVIANRRRRNRRALQPVAAH